MEEKSLILLVDDDRLNLKRAQEILLDAEYRIAAAMSGEQAIKLLEKTVPDLILLDLNMPGMDGFTTYEEIRKIPAVIDVPVIFLTAQDDVQSEIHGFELGADDFIRKPFVSSIVLKRVARSLESARLRNVLADEVAHQTSKAEERKRELEKISVEVTQTLAATIDTKDPYTKGHSARVADYSVLMAGKLGWDENQIEDLRIMALLHDVGKVAVPDRVLNKPGKLEAEEFEIIKSHTTAGDMILKGVSSLNKVCKVARHHHERYDGTGYPDQISGTDIEIEARIVCIADAYDAMSSDRIYRNALDKAVIREELVNGKGTQFDPKLIDLFLILFDSGDLDAVAAGVSQKPGALDLSDLLSTMSEEGNYNGAIKLSHSELVKIYSYLKNSNDRYGAGFTIILINLEYEDGPRFIKDHLTKAMAAMEYSIVQCLRKTDMTSRVSNSQQIVVLTEADDNYLTTIVERIFAGYYKNCLYTDIKPSYEINY